MSVRTSRFGYGGPCRHDDRGEVALAFDAVTLRYPGAGTDAIADFSLRLDPGRCCALIGHNGCGKSTVLKAAAGLLHPRHGAVAVHGWEAGRCRHRVAYLPQRSAIDWRFPVDVAQLVLAGRYVHLGWFRRPGAEDRRLLAEILARLDIADIARTQIGALSGGQQQRALLARTLIQRGDLLLLDEPLGAVDVETRKLVAEILAELRAEGRTIVVATHDFGPGSEGFDEVVCLHEGRRVEVPAERLAEMGHSHLPPGTT